MRRSRWRPASRVLVVGAVVATMFATGVEPAHAADTVENIYEDRGPWEVTDPQFPVDIVWDDGRPTECPAVGAPSEPYTYVYSEGIGAFGTHPVIVWGNGTDLNVPSDATCEYHDALEHLATWGFIVVAVNQGQVGDGDALEDARLHIIAENSNPSSPFFQKVATNLIGVAGHSQGAMGAINAQLNSGGAFQSILALSTADREDLEDWNWSCQTFGFCEEVPMPAESAMESLGAPIFFARGSGLHNDAPCNDDDWMSDKTAGDWVPSAGRPFVNATLRVDPPNPPTAANCPDYPSPTYPHFDLSKGLGYMTAWFVYTLGGDTVARSAFVGNPPEIWTHTANWEGVTWGTLP